MARVNLAWTPRPANENVKFYKVYEVHPTGQLSVVGYTTSNTLLIADVSQGSHTYRVAGVGPNGEGLFREVTTLVFPPFNTPGIPDNFTAVADVNP